MISRSSLIICFIALIVNSGQSQIAIDTNVTINDLISNIADESIAINNYNFIGSDSAKGIFTTVDSTNLEMDEGIIFSTGLATYVNTPNNGNYAGFQYFLPGDSLLSFLSSTNTHDAQCLEINFIPNNDLITLNLIFGSEEYPEWVNVQGFNESIGIFITGFNPIGNNYENYNIAKVPNTDLHICIDNINNITPMNQEFYVDNTNGQFIQFNGFTKLIKVFCYCIPDFVYNVKIVIADSYDFSNDSGIFIEKDSFKSVHSTDLLSFSF